MLPHYGIHGYDYTFNPAAFTNGQVDILFRADRQHRHHSEIFRALSTDGLNIDSIDSQPFITASGTEKDQRGREDPRATVFGKQLYVTLTGYEGWASDRKHLTSIMVVHFPDIYDLSQRSKPVPVMDRNKNGVLLSGKVNSQFALLHRPDFAGVSIPYSDSPFGPFQDAGLIPGLQPRPDSPWDCKRVGAGIDINTEYGTLVLYHGVGKSNVYNMGATLHVPDDPKKVIARSRQPLLTPQEPYELDGHIKNVVFPSGAVVLDDNSTVRIYYGAADRVVAVAEGTIDDIINSLEELPLAA